MNFFAIDHFFSLKSACFLVESSESLESQGEILDLKDILKKNSSNLCLTLFHHQGLDLPKFSITRESNLSIPSLAMVPFWMLFLTLHLK